MRHHAAGAQTTTAEGQGPQRRPREQPAVVPSNFLHPAISPARFNHKTGDFTYLFSSIGISSFANASFESFPNAGLDHAFHDLQPSGIGVNKFGQPLLLTRSTVAHGSNIYNKSPYVLYYNPATETWAPASFPANEVESWNGSPNEFVTDDNGDLLLCGKDRNSE